MLKRKDELIVCFTRGRAWLERAGPAAAGKNNTTFYLNRNQKNLIELE